MVQSKRKFNNDLDQIALSKRATNTHLSCNVKFFILGRVPSPPNKMTCDTHQMTSFRQINGRNCNNVVSFLDDDKTFNEN